MKQLVVKVYRRCGKIEIRRFSITMKDIHQGVKYMYFKYIRAYLLEFEPSDLLEWEYRIEIERY